MWSPSTPWVISSLRNGPHSKFSFLEVEDAYPHIWLPLKMKCRCGTAAAAAKSLQSCPTLCDPIDCSPPGSPIPGILQARTLEWAAISFPEVWDYSSLIRAREPSLLKSNMQNPFCGRLGAQACKLEGQAWQNLRYPGPSIIVWTALCSWLWQTQNFPWTVCPGGLGLLPGHSLILLSPLENPWTS